MNSPTILMIAVGCVIFLIAFLGCCGAIKENTCMLYLVCRQQLTNRFYFSHSHAYSSIVFSSHWFCCWLWLLKSLSSGQHTHTRDRLKVSLTRDLTIHSPNPNQIRHFISHGIFCKEKYVQTFVSHSDQTMKSI